MTSDERRSKLIADFAALLKISPVHAKCTDPEEAALRSIRVRLKGLGYVRTCGRCAGTGEHSRCQIYGTRCFGCGGSGKVALKLTRTLYKTIDWAASYGVIDEYLKDLAEAINRRNTETSNHAH